MYGADIGSYVATKRYRLASSLALLLLILYLSFISRLPQLQDVSTYGASAFAGIRALRPREPKVLQLIALWTGNTSSQFFSQYFQTIRQNELLIHLLFVNRDSGSGCVEGLEQHSHGNVRVICMKDAELYDLYTDYLCNRWNCTAIVREKVHKELEIRQDYRNTEWKPLYGSIFEKYLAPHRYAAWTDIDQMLGDFSKLPSYAFDGTFDLVTFDIGGQEKNNVYLRGQFTAFRRSLEIDNIWTGFHGLESPASFVKHYPRGNLDERFTSVQYMSHPAVNWIQFSGGIGGDNSLEERPEKIVQSGLNIIQIPINRTREQIISDLASIDSTGYPTSFEPQKNTAVTISDDCPDHWLKADTARCIDDSKMNSSTTQLYTARYNGTLGQARVATVSPRPPERKYLNHFLFVKRRPWFVVPQPLAIGDVFEYSNSHVSSWNKGSLRSSHCYAERLNSLLCSNSSTSL